MNPFGMLMMTSHRQCPSGGACESLWNVDDDVTQAMPKGVLVNPFGMLMMTSHRQCPRGGGCL